jgi:hypothetical protein
MKLLIVGLLFNCLSVVAEGFATMRLGAAAASLPAREADGEGRGGRGDGRGAGRRGGRGGFVHRAVASPFVGANPGLGFIFDVAVDGTSSDNIDMFTKGHEALERWAGTVPKKYTAAYAQAVHDLAMIVPAALADPVNETFVVQENWKAASRERMVRAQADEDFLANLYNEVFGQCTQTLKDKLRSLPGFAATNQNGIDLLVLLRTTLNRVQAADTNVVMGSTCRNVWLSW